MTFFRVSALMSIILSVPCALWATPVQGATPTAQHARIHKSSTPLPSPAPTPGLTAEHAGTAAASAITTLLFIALGFCMYWIPALVAFARQHHNRGAIAVLNFLLGWTVAGWIAALIWAFTSPAPVVIAKETGQ